jgi:hypothetical protein
MSLPSELVSVNDEVGGNSESRDCDGTRRTYLKILNDWLIAEDLRWQGR